LAGHLPDRLWQDTCRLFIQAFWLHLLKVDLTGHLFDRLWQDTCPTVYSSILAPPFKGGLMNY
jgi:hypothetical protein